MYFCSIDLFIFIHFWLYLFRIFIFLLFLTLTLNIHHLSLFLTHTFVFLSLSYDFHPFWTSHTSFVRRGAEHLQNATKITDAPNLAWHMLLKMYSTFIWNRNTLSYSFHDINSVNVMKREKNCFLVKCLSEWYWSIIFILFSYSTVSFTLCMISHFIYKISDDSKTTVIMSQRHVS